MTLAAWIVIGVTIAVLVLLATESAPPDFVFLGALVFLCVLGYIDIAGWKLKSIETKDAFAGFVNSGVLMVGALFIVAAGMREAGVMDIIGTRLLGGVKTEVGAMGVIAAFTIVTSAFFNNTPIVAMLVPVVIGWCRKREVPPSKLLIPLSFFTIMGGACTLIGTSTNLVVDGLLINKEMPGLGFFELTWVGLPCAIVGVIYMFTIGRKVLPVRKDLIEQLGESQREYLVEMMVQPGCGLIGKTIEAAGLRSLKGLFLFEISRKETVIGPVSPDEVLEENDRLIFTGVVDTIVDLKRIPGLVPAAESSFNINPAAQRGRRLCEAVISASSPLIGQTVRHANFRTLYNAVVVAIHRNGQRLTTKIGDVELQPGDTLLLQTGPHFAQTHRNNADFYLVSDVENSHAPRHDRAWIAIAIFVGLVTGMVFFPEPMLVAFAAAGLMIATRCLTLAEARASVEWPVLIAVGASFGLGTALEKSGAAKEISEILVNTFTNTHPIFVMAAIYFVTMALNELITNNGAAVLAFPFCIESAELMDVDPRPFIIAVTMAASFAFASPIGYQTHMMVFGPGGYRFRDFMKVGIPLNLLLWIVATLIISVVWPFTPAK